MDSISNSFGRYVIEVVNDLGDLSTHISGNGWICISAILLVCGWFWLQGSKVRGA